VIGGLVNLFAIIEWDEDKIYMCPCYGMQKCYEIVEVLKKIRNALCG